MTLTNFMSSCLLVNFIYSEKATQFCEISTNYLSCVLQRLLQTWLKLGVEMLCNPRPRVQKFQPQVQGWKVRGWKVHGNKSGVVISFNFSNSILYLSGGGVLILVFITLTFASKKFTDRSLIFFGLILNIITYIWFLSTVPYYKLGEYLFWNNWDCQFCD